jgi:hypothetical protein
MQLDLFYPPKPKLPSDICIRRHHGNANSEEANRRSAPFHESDEARIEKIIHAQGSRGATSAELEVLLGKAKNKFSGRLTALKANNKVRALGERDGCAVLVHRDFEGKV